MTSANQNSELKSYITEPFNFNAFTARRFPWSSMSLMVQMKIILKPKTYSVTLHNSARSSLTRY